jgi:8-oxo-dGTP pyrophosphatase MutT (NUDIX family)
MTPASLDPRLSASVILVRDGAAGLETFMVRRHAQSRVAPSAYVFPGGTVRADDVDLPGADSWTLAETIAQRSDALLVDADALAVYATAVRELFEEAGVLLACDQHGDLLQVDAQAIEQQERLAAARLTLQAGERSLAWLLAELSWRPAFDRLVPFSHWVTPIGVPARFDTWFFVADMPRGQEALHCTIETSEGVWLTPGQLLDGDYSIVFPTEKHLRRIAAFRSAAELLDFARAKRILRVQPELTRDGGAIGVRMAPDLVDAW